MTQDDANKLNRTQALEKGNELAFPLSTGSGYPNKGLTKREYIATQLLSGAISDDYKQNERMVIEVIRATELLLIELNKKQ
jgi:hypothetical protein